MPDIDPIILVQPIYIEVIPEVSHIEVIPEIAQIEVMSPPVVNITNTGGVDFTAEEFALIDGAQTLNLARSPSSIAGVYINGLLQRQGDYEYLGSSLMLFASANAVAGDVATVNYL